MNVFRVFLASPSDLEEERKAAQEVVEGLNPIIRKVDSILELRGWEDRSPGFGRPQEHINEHVDGCDLFVGILSHRWGSHTGKYSSGFEEEFERAVSRRRRSESPEIDLYFKRVDDASDPGVQLRRVLEFRDRIEQERELLLRWPRFVDSLAACLKCIPVAARLARISLDQSSCRRCCACG